MKKRVLNICVLATLLGCASNPDNIQKSSVSELIYQDYDCKQIALESDRVSKRASELYVHLKGKAKGDAIQTGVGVLLFWPALFLLEGGDGPEAQEYARLTGEYEALESVAIKKRCSIDFQPIVTEEMKKEETTPPPTKIDNR